MKAPAKNTISEHILIEALFAPNCGSREATLQMIDSVSLNQSVKIDLKETTINTTPEADSAKFLGSPSIRIDGKDIEPESRENTDYGVGWRVYLNEAGRFSKMIPKELFETALASHIPKTLTWGKNGRTHLLLLQLQIFWHWNLVVLLSLLLPLSVFSAEKQVEIDIQGMTCNLWPIAIKKSLSGIEGVSKVQVSYKEKIGRVTIEQTVPEAELLQAIKRAGPYSGTIKKTATVKWNANRQETEEPFEGRNNRHYNCCPMLLYPYFGSAIECDRSWSGIGVSGLYPPSNLGCIFAPNDIRTITTHEDKEIVMKTFDQLEKEDAPNIHKRLSSHERKLRTILLNKIFQLNGPVPLSEIMLQADEADIDVSLSISRLKEKGLISLQDDGSVTGLYPFSAIPTRHKVQLKDGRSFFAMCAIDSLGIAYELEEDASIYSSCSKCNADISIEITHGKISRFIPTTIRTIHVALGDYKNWASTCWNNMNFFCTEKHLEEWLEGTNLNQSDIYSLSIQDAGVVGESIFGK